MRYDQYEVVLAVAYTQVEGEQSLMDAIALPGGWALAARCRRCGVTEGDLVALPGELKVRLDHMVGWAESHKPVCAGEDAPTSEPI